MSFFGSFFGNDQRKDIAAGKAAADAQLQNGYDQATGIYNQKYGEAQGYYRPYAEAGNSALGMYQNALGLNGEAGGKTAMGAYSAAANPSLGYMQDMAQRGLDRQANARGSLNSGGNALAGARARMELGYQDYNNWMGRLQGQQGMGLQVAGQQAGMAEGAGRYQSDMRSGLGQQMAQNSINYSNALAASRSTGINNLIGLGGTIAKAYGAKG